MNDLQLSIHLDLDLAITIFKNNCGSWDKMLNKICLETEGELDEFYSRKFKDINIDYLVYGNNELLIFVTDEDEPYTYCVDVYGDKRVLTETFLR